jgi:sensor histidine kinase YesM
MTLYDFILSDKKSIRVQRHLVFWLLWWLYFAVSYYHYQQTGLQKIEFENWNTAFFIKTLLLLSIHVFSCYCFIYFLIPRYLVKAKYAAFITGIFILSTFIFFTSLDLHQLLFPLINSRFGDHTALVSKHIRWASISAGLLSAPKVIAAATAIKLLKQWFLKQKEKERLEKEKLISDLRLLKTQVRPVFLFHSLDSIYAYSRKNPAVAAGLLLKLSDLLSYTLYESDHTLVPLDKEIKLIRDYMIIEKTRMGTGLEMDIAVNGETGDKMIAPLLLLPFIENSFSNCDRISTETFWINLSLRIENNELAMKLIVGKSDEATALQEDDNGLAKVRKRLEILYPARHELKTIIEPEVMMTHLKIALESANGINQHLYTSNDIKTYAAI